MKVSNLFLVMITAVSLLVSSHVFPELHKEKIEAHRAYYARELALAKIGRYAIAGVATAAAVYGALQFFGVIKKTVSFTEAEGKALKDIVREHAKNVVEKQNKEQLGKVRFTEQNRDDFVQDCFCGAR